MVSLFNTTDAETGASLETPPISSIWGQTYLQGGDLGIASYHFDSPSSCYISYLNAPSAWVLDDGSKPPKKKYFVNVAYDEKSRTFRGVINWPVKFAGESTWTYTMRFSDNFAIIEGGGLLTDTSISQTFAKDLIYWRMQDHSTILGNVYCQGDQALGVASYHFPRDGPQGAYISYEDAPEHWKLDNGMSPPAKKPFLNAVWNASERVFTGDIEWEEGFGGCAKWSYKMVFSEDMKTIEGGMNEKFDKEGVLMGSSKFGRGQSLNYHIFDEAAATMREMLRRRRG